MNIHVQVFVGINIFISLKHTPTVEFCMLMCDTVEAIDLHPPLNYILLVRWKLLQSRDLLTHLQKHFSMFCTA